MFLDSVLYLPIFFLLLALGLANEEGVKPPFCLLVHLLVTCLAQPCLPVSLLMRKYVHPARNSRSLTIQAVQVDTKPASDVLAGAVARAASQGTIHPLDTLKVRMQHGKPTLSKMGKLIPPQGAISLLAFCSCSNASGHCQVPV